MSQRVSFFIYSASTGLPLSGVSCTFTYYSREDSGGTSTSLLPGPTIVDKGGGRYEFVVSDADLPYGSTVFYIVDTTNASSARFQSGQVTSTGDITVQVSPIAPGFTPFGVFDSDVQFQDDAVRMDNFVRLKLGEPVMVVHLSSSQVYAAFEEACLEYSAIVNQYQAKSVLTSFLGAQTGSLSGSENRFIQQNLEFQRKLAEPFGDVGNITVNTQRPLYSGSVELQVGVQKYNLNPIIAQQLTGAFNGNISIKDIFHFSPLSAYRSFGTTSAVNYLNAQFNFESFTPETIFYLLPIWEDILRGMQFETSNRVRRSNYSYELHDNVLTLYPVPTQNVNLYFTFMAPADPTQPPTIQGLSGSQAVDNSYYGVANLSNVPFGNINYSTLNSISKQWIREMAFSLAKEVEGQIRAKMASIPIPNGDLQLNGPEMIADARAQQDRLREELKAMLEELTYDKLAARQAEQTAANNQVMMQVPMGIYIG